jgi:hypothetical protein
VGEYTLPLAYTATISQNNANMFTKQGGIMYNWGSWHTLVPLIVGVCGLIGWAFYEHFGTSNPMIPLTVLRNRTASISYFGTMIHGIIVRYQISLFPIRSNFFYSNLG